MSFRENLLYLRATHGMTQEQLAEQLGVSRQSVTKWESDKSTPEMDKLIKLAQLFDCTLDELVQGDLTDCQVDDCQSDDTATVMPLDSVSEDASSPARPTPVEDSFGYEEHVNSFADRISGGVLVLILGVAISVVFYSLGDPDSAVRLLPENVSAAIGTLCVLAGVALSLILIIPAGLERAQFVRQHPHLEDFYTEEQKERVRRSFTYELIGGIILIFAGTIIIILFSDGPFEEVLGVPLMLACIAVGARSIVHGSMVFGLSNIKNYNNAAVEALTAQEIEDTPLTPEQKADLLKKGATDKRIGALCGAIMIVATMVGLVMLFVPGYQNAFFWLAWPIGGLLCGLVSTLMKGFAKEA